MKENGDLFKIEESFIILFVDFGYFIKSCNVLFCNRRYNCFVNLICY